MVKYWTPNAILSYNRMLNFIVSMRGAGKTFGALRYVINKCYERDRQFVYLRRNEEEVKRVKDTLLKGLEAEDALPAQYKVLRSEIKEASKDEQVAKKDGWKTRGYILPLSLASQLKSSAFPRVDYIIFDEFIAENGRYLTDEIQKFTSILSTICRARANVKILCLGNLVSAYNKYFNTFGLSSELTRGYGIHKCRACKQIALENYRAEEVRSLYQHTGLLPILQKAGQDQYVIDNQALKDSEEGVIDPPDNRLVHCSFILEGNNYVISRWEEGLYIFRGRQKGQLRINLDKCLRDGMVNGFARNMAVDLIKNFATIGKCYYSNPGVKALCEQLIYS